ncbi:MAG: TonB-dependent receptor [Flavobacteriales bacterium]|nr:TonB-dependent receptor [Flavobacteriales bacterium]
MLRKIAILPTFLLAFSFLISATAFAQTGIVKGKILDAENKQALPGANFLVLENLKGAAANLDGEYLLELPVGNYHAVFSFTGMQNDTLEFIIEADKIITLNVELIPEDQMLDLVVVAAGKFEQNIEDLTVSMEIIKPQLVENKNTTSIETALEQTPGLTILDQEPQIRGGSGFTFGVGSRVAVVVDGMPMLSGDAGRPEWGFIPVENLDQIEVIKGASSVLYGSSALSGVINIRTAWPTTEPQTKINYTTGFYSKPEIAGAKWWDKAPLYGGINFFHSRIIKQNLDLVTGGNFFYDHGYIGPPKTDPGVTDTLTNFSEKDLQKLRGRFNFNLRYRSKKIEGLNFGLSGNGMISHTNFALAWLDDSANIYRAYPGAISLQQQKIFNLDPFIQYANGKGIKHSLRTRLFYNDNTISNNQSNNSKLFYGEYQFQRQFPWISDFNFTAGVVSTYAHSNAQIYSGGGSPKNSLINIAGYSQFDKKMWKILNLSAGFRMEYFEMNKTESVVKPIFRAGLNLRVMKATWLRYSYGQGFRFPTITERYILLNTGTFGVFPNPHLNPETSTAYEVGIKQGFKFKKFMGYFDLAGFHQEYQNTIEYLFGLWDVTVAPAGFKFLNTGNTRVRGIDISMMGKAEIKKDIEITFLGGYTYVVPLAMQKDYVYAYDNAPGGAQALSYNTTSMDSTQGILKYRFQHTAKIDLDLKWKKFSCGYSARLYSSMKNVDKALETLELLTAALPYYQDILITDYWKNHQGANLIHDARIGYEITKQHRISIVANNLLNKSYMLRPMKIESPRTLAVQWIWKW